MKVLLCQNFRGRHHGHLITCIYGQQRRARRHQRFTGPHITLHQTQHGMALLQILTDLLMHPLLCPGGFERQALQHALLKIRRRRQCHRGLGFYPLPQLEQAQMMGGQFLQR